MQEAFEGMKPLGEEAPYTEGYAAFRKGVSRFECLYKWSYRDICLWQMGWHDSRFAAVKRDIISSVAENSRMEIFDNKEDEVTQ